MTENLKNFKLDHQVSLERLDQWRAKNNKWKEDYWEGDGDTAKPLKEHQQSHWKEK